MTNPMTSQDLQIGPIILRLEQDHAIVPLAGKYRVLPEPVAKPDAFLQVTLSDSFEDKSEYSAEYPAFQCRRPTGSSLELWRPDGRGEITTDPNQPVTAKFRGAAMPHTLEAMIRLTASITLPRKDALILHSSAIEDTRGAYVFSGLSGAGKSTIAALLSDNFPVRRLSDELLLLVRSEGQWRLEVAPFTGKVELPWGESSPLLSMNFLEQSATNQRTAISPAAAMAELPKHVVTYAHDPHTLSLVLNLVGDLVENISCYRLRFTKQPSVAEVLQLTCP